MDDKRPKDPAPWLPPADRPPRILVVRLSALGDVLHALPVLSALRARFPAARIDWAVEDRAVDLLRHRSDLDRVLAFPRTRLSSALKGIPRPIDLLSTAKGFVQEMRAGQYDVAVLSATDRDARRLDGLDSHGLPLAVEDSEVEAHRFSVILPSVREWSASACRASSPQ